jgi:hypothetical protein
MPVVVGLLLELVALVEGAAVENLELLILVAVEVVVLVVAKLLVEVQV